MRSLTSNEMANVSGGLHPGGGGMHPDVIYVPPGGGVPGPGGGVFSQAYQLYKYGGMTLSQTADALIEASGGTMAEGEALAGALDIFTGWATAAGIGGYALGTIAYNSMPESLQDTIGGTEAIAIDNIEDGFKWLFDKL